MEKLLYISFLNEDLRPGYKKKIHSQAVSISEIGYETSLIIVSNHGIKYYIYNGGERKTDILKKFTKKRKKIERNIIDDLFAFRDFYRAVIEYYTQFKYKYVYVRRIVPIMPGVLSLLNELKKMGAIIIYEYPTLPWKEEMRRKTGLSRKLFYIMDTLFYKKLISIPHMITYLGVYSGTDTRFFQIQNCGRADDFPCKENVNIGPDLNLIAVAHVSYSHGYDLLIKAMKTYYDSKPNRKIVFHIVGTTRPELKDLTKQYELEDYIIFHGFKTGIELDELFEIADIGVNKIRIDTDATKSVGMTTLKTVEYTFRGLPQISGAGFTVDRNHVDVPNFLYVFKNNEYDLMDVLSFYDALDVTPHMIRAYAKQHMSWNKVFLDVFEKLNEMYMDQEINE